LTTLRARPTCFLGWGLVLSVGPRVKCQPGIII
jgi:hypothetical protein